MSLNVIGKGLRSGIAILGISVGLLVLAEAALRLVFPEKAAAPRWRPEMKLHSEYISALKPNIERTFARTELNGGDAITWGTNVHFRGKPLRKGADLRVVIYGDSKKLFFRERDNHWNDAGQDLTARETARFVFETFIEGCESIPADGCNHSN